MLEKKVSVYLVRGYTPMNHRIASSLGILIPILLLAPAGRASEARDIWLDECARCHGEAGKGDTPLGRSLHVLDYSSKEAQAKFSDEKIVELISQGKIRNGKKVMPAYRGTLSPAENKALIAYIRSLAKN